MKPKYRIVSREVGDYPAWVVEKKVTFLWLFSFYKPVDYWFSLALAERHMEILEELDMRACAVDITKVK